MNLWIDTQALIVTAIVVGLLVLFLKTDVFVRKSEQKKGEEDVRVD